MNTWDIIYEYCENHPNCTNHSCRKTVVVQARISVPKINLLSQAISQGPAHRKTVTVRLPIPLAQFVGIALLSLGIGGMIGPMIPEMRLEAMYLTSRATAGVKNMLSAKKPPLPKSAPVVFEPLEAPDGTIITPASQDFSIIIPKIGVNAPVVGNVDPAKPQEYDEALLNGVAHASTSFFPDQNGTVYLFSHSTNYEWFVKDLNAVFYLVKNLNAGDTVVLIYKGTRYTYMIADKKVVAATKTNYLYPVAGRRSLILETCWPPGSTAERLLIFADPVGTKGKQI